MLPPEKIGEKKKSTLHPGIFCDCWLVVCDYKVNVTLNENVFFFLQFLVAAGLLCLASADVSEIVGKNQYLPPSKGYHYDRPSVPFPSPRPTPSYQTPFPSRPTFQTSVPVRPTYQTPVSPVRPTYQPPAPSYIPPVSTVRPISVSRPLPSSNVRPGPNLGPSPSVNQGTFVGPSGGGEVTYTTILIIIIIKGKNVIFLYHWPVLNYFVVFK